MSYFKNIRTTPLKYIFMSFILIHCQYKKLHYQLTRNILNLHFKIIIKKLIFNET